MNQLNNGCSYTQCDNTCQLCDNKNRFCRWLLHEELYRRNNKSCTFNATNAPFRLGETERECVDACRANRVDFGGENCNFNFSCESCAGCEDPKLSVLGQLILQYLQSQLQHHHNQLLQVFLTEK